MQQLMRQCSAAASTSGAAAAVPPRHPSTRAVTATPPESWRSREEVGQGLTCARAISLSSRRTVLRQLGMAVLALAGAGPGAPAMAAGNGAGAGNAALSEYMDLEGKGRLRDRKALDDFRLRYGIRRTLDGRVELRGKKGDWYNVRLDMEVPGAILLRHEKTGNVFAIETEGLAQVDLSDDYILLMMFGDGAWEAEMAPIEFEEEGGKQVAQLALQEKEFREFVGLLKELEAESGVAPK